MVVVGKHFTFLLMWLSGKISLNCQTNIFRSPNPTSINQVQLFGTSCGTEFGKPGLHSQRRIASTEPSVIPGAPSLDL